MPILSPVALLRSAYLLMFCTFGYRYVLDASAAPVREQLHNPLVQTRVLDGVSWRLDDCKHSRVSVSSRSVRSPGRQRLGLRAREADRGLAALAAARPDASRVAHAVLGHTVEGVEQDGPRTPRNIREVEAEGVALLCSAALSLDGAEGRGATCNIGFKGGETPERSCQRIFKAADAILRAVRDEATDATGDPR